VTDLSDPADERIVKKTISEQAPTIPEPKRLKGHVPPVWNERMGQFTPRHLYGKGSYRYGHLYETKKAAVEAEYNSPLPSLIGD
jgi:hypothetical protein